MQCGILSAKDVLSLVEHFKRGESRIKEYRAWPNGIDTPFVYYKLNRNDESALRMGDERMFLHVIMCGSNKALEVKNNVDFQRYALFVDPERQEFVNRDAMEVERPNNQRASVVPIKKEHVVLLGKMQELETVDIYQQMSSVMLRDLEGGVDASSVMFEFLEDLYADSVLRGLIDANEVERGVGEVNLEDEVEPILPLDGFTLPAEMDTDGETLDQVDDTREMKPTDAELSVLIAERTDGYTAYLRMMCGTAGLDIRSAFVKLPEVNVIQQDSWESYAGYLDPSYFAALHVTNNYLRSITRDRFNLGIVMTNKEQDMKGFSICAEHSGKVFNQAKSSNPFRNSRTRYTLLEAQADLNTVMRRMYDHFVEGRSKKVEMMPTYLRVTNQPWRGLV